jgi:GT2 family glycosyltransferase
MNGDTLFWIGLGSLAYIYCGYPVLLACSRLLLRTTLAAGDSSPRVSMVLAAYNESEVIEDKIGNALEADYPRDRLELIIVSDASSDGTDEIVAKHREQGVHLIRQEPQAGKAAALNRGVEAATGEILVFSDANAMFSKAAIRHLTAPFADPRVGAVSGVLGYEGDAAHSGETVYWRYEQLVKGLESGMGRLLGANGAIFAIRRDVYPPLHPLDVSDFRIPYEALLKGQSAVLVPEAAATERVAPSIGGEMARKVRIMSRALPMFFSLLLRTLASGRPFVAWQLVSHKILREIQAIFFLAMLIGAVWGTAAGTALGRWLLVAQAVGYGIGAAGWLSSRLRRLLPVKVATYVTMIAVASVWALCRWLGGRNRATWRSTERTAPPA